MFGGFGFSLPQYQQYPQYCTPCPNIFPVQHQPLDQMYYSGLSQSDVEFAINSNSPFDPQFLQKTMTSNKPYDCSRHIIVQEYLRDVCGRKLDQPTYDSNVKNAQSNPIFKQVYTKRK